MLLNIAIIFGSFASFIFLSVILKKIYYRLVLKKRYFIFPKMNTKGIANVAMVIAIATAILLLLTIISSGLFGILFRAYPGWRVNIESILIKIGGLCFGPIIGLFVGFGTDLLSVALTAGMFHYGYCIAAGLFGLLAGLVSSIKSISGNRKVVFHLCVFLLLILSFAIQFFFFNFMVDINDSKITDTPGAISLAILGINISFKM
jgi:LytS/YehU family sensor histidine kinase